MQRVEVGFTLLPARSIARWLPLSALVTIVLLASACSASRFTDALSAASCDRSSLLITDVKITGHAPANALLIENGHIAWIGQQSDAPSHARVLDANGATALPGLIDSHAHFDALPAAKHLQKTLDTTTDIFPITLRQTLASGVTTARAHLSALDDMSQMRELSANDCSPSPRIVLSGPGLLGGSPQVNARLMRGVSSAEDAAAKVRELAEHGAKWLALHGLTRFSDDELDAIFGTADALGMFVMADTDNFPDLARAVGLPIRSGEYLNRSTAQAYPQSLIDAVDARAETLFIVPPVGYYLRSMAYDRGANRHLDPSLFQFTNKDIATQMRKTLDEDFDADDYIQSIVAAGPTFPRKFSQLMNSAATLVIGSDSGSLGQFHHDAIWKEMQAWQELGASPAQIVNAATIDAARLLNRDDIGRLALGARGDILLYDGNILDGVFDRSRVVGVIKGGVIFDEKKGSKKWGQSTFSRKKGVRVLFLLGRFREKGSGKKYSDPFFLKEKVL